VDHLNIGDVYESIATLVTPLLDPGIIELAMSTTWVLGTANRSIFIRHRINGGAWTEFISEPSDATNRMPMYYAYPKNWVGGVVTVEVEARKEGSNADFDILFMDLIVKEI